MVAHADGCSEPINPGGYACGGVDIAPYHHVPALEHGVQLGRWYAHGSGATNNMAEYNAVLDALRAIYAAGWRGPVVLRTTSQILVRQYRNEYGCHVPELQSLLARLHRASSYFSDLTIHWISRTDNVRADALARRAYRDALRAERRGQ